MRLCALAHVFDSHSLRSQAFNIGDVFLDLQARLPHRTSGIAPARENNLARILGPPVHKFFNLGWSIQRRALQ
jgi:hypothetical protein